VFPINRFGDAGGLIIARKKRSTHRESNREDYPAAGRWSGGRMQKVALELDF
jgi:hypothetical protein